MVTSIDFCTNNTTQMFQAVKAVFRKPFTPITVQNEEGHRMERDEDKVKILGKYFKEKYEGKQLETFDQENIGPLKTPITYEEVEQAITKLNNNRASGPDNTQAELLKAAPREIKELLVNSYNEIFSSRSQVNLGVGKLILLQKPGKPAGPTANLRPIVLLPASRKILSLVTLNRIKDKIETYLSPSQAGFRRDRSTSDIVWTHRWLVSHIENVKEEFTILGIDMSSAFDTINRHKLIDVCKTFLEEDEVKLIRLLLSETSLTFTSGSVSTNIDTKVGTPQGDGLSPVLFTIYLEAALREVREKIDTTNMVPAELAYADDVDFLFKTKLEAEENYEIIASTLLKWNLKVNKSKTEITTINRTTTDWHQVKKLGSLLNTKADIERRKNLATIALRKMYTIWIRNHLISDDKIIRLYKALILPILLYNSSTWGLTKADEESIDRFHRKQLRSILQISWKDKVSNEELYNRTKSNSISQNICRYRWTLFGHILRRSEEIPANLAMKKYFIETNSKKYPGKKPTNLPIMIQKDLHKINPFTFMSDHNYCSYYRFQNQADLENLRDIAQNRDRWRELTQLVEEGRQGETRQPDN